MILSGSAVHTKGLGWSLVSFRNRLMAAWRSTIDRKTPRLRRRRVSLAKKPSTAFSHMGGVIVEHDVDNLAGRNVGFDAIEKAYEFLVTVTLHAAADDLAFQDVERGEEGGGAVPLVIVGPCMLANEVWPAPFSMTMSA
jgi:hypothetical protein